MASYIVPDTQTPPSDWLLASSGLVPMHAHTSMHIFTQPHIHMHAARPSSCTNAHIRGLVALPGIGAAPMGTGTGTATPAGTEDTTATVARLGWAFLRGFKILSITSLFFYCLVPPTDS